MPPNTQANGDIVPAEERKAFLARMLPFAQKWEAQTGVPADVYLAMMANESNYGRDTTYFGIKGSYNGLSGNFNTWEDANGQRQQIVDQFAEYATPDDAHKHLLEEMASDRYKDAWAKLQAARSGTGPVADTVWRQWLKDINHTSDGLGWATDPDYAQTITDLKETNDRYRRGIAQNDADVYQARRQRLPNGALTAGAVGGVRPPPPPPPPTLPNGEPAAEARGGLIPRFAGGGSTGGNQALFVKLYWPYAAAWEKATGIPASVMLGIGASESNWGAAGSIFGIKGASPSGQSQNYPTWEYVNGQRVQTNANFAVYNNPNEAFSHFAGLVTSGRYAPAYQQFQRDGNTYNFIANLQRAGYATDPNWVNNVATLSRQADSIATSTGAKTQPAPTPQQVQANIAAGNPPKLPSVGTGGAAVTDPNKPVTVDDLMQIQAVTINQENNAIKDLVTAKASASTAPGPVNPSTGMASPSQADLIQRQIDAHTQSRDNATNEWVKLGTLNGKIRPEMTEEQKQTLLQNQVKLGIEAANSQVSAGSLAVSAARLPIEASGSRAELGRSQADLVGSYAQEGNASANMLDALQKYFAGTVSADIATGNYIESIVAGAFTRAYDTALLAVKKGELSTTAFSNVVTAIAAQTSAEAQWAMRNLAEAQYVSEENWKRAERLLPAGQEYMPGMGPDDERAQAMRKMGIVPMVQKAVPLAADWNDPWANLRQADAQRVSLGQTKPGAAFAPAIAGQTAVAGDIYKDYKQPFTFTPPAGFEKPLAVDPEKVRQDMAYQGYGNALTGFLANMNAGVPSMPNAPAFSTPNIPGGYDPENTDANGMPLTEAEKKRRADEAAAKAKAASQPVTGTSKPEVPLGSAGGYSRGGVLMAPPPLPRARRR